MPCRDNWSSDAGYGGTTYVENPINKEMKKRLDLTTRLLCSLCRVLVKRGVAQYLREVPGLTEWWVNHQEEDRRREQEEKKQRRREYDEAVRRVDEAQSKLEKAKKRLL